MIQTQNLQFSYPNQSELSFPDLECAAAESLLILGNSGKGKTTLLHLLGLLLAPNTGRVIIDGCQVSSFGGRMATNFRAKNIGIIFQKSHLVQSLSVQENLLLANYFANNLPNKKRVTYLVEQLGIVSLLSKKTHELSIGEQQRVGIARALMNKPQVILADEPTSNLDDANCKAVIQLLETECKEIRAALVIVTHDKRLKDVVEKQILL